jgi:hypothetical protein
MAVDTNSCATALWMRGIILTDLRSHRSNEISLARPSEVQFAKTVLSFVRIMREYGNRRESPRSPFEAAFHSNFSLETSFIHGSQTLPCVRIHHAQHPDRPSAIRLVAVIRYRPRHQAAHPPLAEGVLFPHLLDSRLQGYELQPFFRITDCSASLSRLRSPFFLLPGCCRPTSTTVKATMMPVRGISMQILQVLDEC